MQRSILAAAVGSMLIMTACQGADRSGDVGTTADTPSGQMAGGTVATVDLADVAGRWSVEAVPESGDDRSPTRYTINATPDRSGWTITFENGATIPVTVVAVEGDSIITEAGPYASVRRANTQVRTRSVMRMEGNQLVGWTRARYETSGPDTVLVLRTAGTRAP